MEHSFTYPGGTIDTERGEADFIDITVSLFNLIGKLQRLKSNSNYRYPAYRAHATTFPSFKTARCTLANTQDFDGTSPDTHPVNMRLNTSIAQ